MIRKLFRDNDVGILETSVCLSAMRLKFHSLPVTTHHTIKCELNGREGLEKFLVQVVYLDVVKKKNI